MYHSGSVVNQASKIYSRAIQAGFEEDEIKRELVLDSCIQAKDKAAFAEQWASRTEEETFRTFVLEYKLIDVEDLDEMPKAWRWWKDQEGSWAAQVNIEMVCRKCRCSAPLACIAANDLL